MGAEDTNKTLIRRLFDECWNNGNLAVVEELFTANFAGHDPAYPNTQGVAGMKQLITTNRTAFPDLRFTIDEMLASGDTVVTRWTATGTHQGTLNGIPPTGKRATVTGLVLTHLSNGKIAEDFVNWDTLGLMRQIGVFPEMAPADISQSAPMQQH